MFHNSRNLLLAGVLALVVVIAAVAWSRRNTTDAAPVTTFATTSQPGYVAQPGGYVPQPNTGAPPPPAYYGSSSVSSSDGYYSSTRRPVYVRSNEYVAPQVVGQPSYDSQVVYNDRPAVRREVYETRRVHRGRSKGKSVAIVAGSAGAGAAIGALAGGGKGAAIGALTGGGAGFVYDRMTHNH